MITQLRTYSSSYSSHHKPYESDVVQSAVVAVSNDTMLLEMSGTAAACKHRRQTHNVTNTIVVAQLHVRQAACGL